MHEPEAHLVDEEPLDQDILSAFCQNVDTILATCTKDILIQGSRGMLIQFRLLVSLAVKAFTLVDPRGSHE
jgi:hypothetical protein